MLRFLSLFLPQSQLNKSDLIAAFPFNNTAKHMNAPSFGEIHADKMDMQAHTLLLK